MALSIDSPGKYPYCHMEILGRKWGASLSSISLVYTLYRACSKAIGLYDGGRSIGNFLPLNIATIRAIHHSPGMEHRTQQSLNIDNIIVESIGTISMRRTNSLEIASSPGLLLSFNIPRTLRSSGGEKGVVGTDMGGWIGGRSGSGGMGSSAHCVCS